MMPPARTHLRAVALGAAASACACALAWPLAGASLAWRGAAGPPWSGQPTSGYSAGLEQCMASAVQVERSVTFTGQMVATPATQRMGMRIELQERAGGQSAFRTVLAPGLGVWRDSEAGVKIYRYVKQITNLAAPAMYRAVVHFRWQGEKGRVLRRADLRTARCVQPLLAQPESSGVQPSATAR